MRQWPMTPGRSFVLMVAGALLHAVSCVCCNTAEFPVQSEGLLEVLVTDGEVPPWPDADLRLNRDRLEIEYTADDDRRYRVVYRVESSWELTSLSVLETPSNVECDRSWSGDFAGHAALLAGVTVVTGSVLIEVSENPRLPQCQAEQLGDFLGLPPERRDIHTNLDTCPNARRGLLDMEP